MSALIDITNQRFVRLLVESRAGKDARGQVTWNVVCDCGTRKVVRGKDMRDGKTKSCGCLNSEMVAAFNIATKTKPGTKVQRKATRAYNSWIAMRNRCNNPNDKHFKHYGARGVKVCERWLNSFTNFLSDMGQPPPKTSIDRKDNDGDYEPGNCRWATSEEQANNKRNNRILEIDGRRMTASQWAREVGINRGLLHDRLQRGWPPEKALYTPPIPAGQTL